MLNLSSNFQREPKGRQKGKRWRLFHAKDFQSLMYPCFTLCCILGIFPYTINASTFEASKPRYILSIVVIGVCSICVLIALYTSPNLDETKMIILPSILANGCVIIFGGFIIVVTFILSGPRMRLLQIILKISSRLPPESYQKLSRLIHTKDIIGFLYVLGMMLILVFLHNMNGALEMYIHLVIFQMDMLYMNCVCILKACFRRINDNLAHMRELMVNDNPRVSKLIYHKQKNPILMIELKALEKQHLIISGIVRMLNMIFCLQLLATVVITFSNIAIDLYYYIIIILKWQNAFPGSTFKAILAHTFYIAYIAYNFIRIALIVWACETGKDEAQQISTSVHDTFNSITDEEIKYELELFSLQILHCENTFSAKGFTVNAKFLATIMGSIATYVLILLQFTFMSDSCERKMAYNNTEEFKYIKKKN